ncbi:hypothetical protein FOA52_013649 [Chlamydomonas sp. UWO 241]|nr:hypothetical protein FOA52_013649 [Chlamydomonas sp. UWO 241]
MYAPGGTGLATAQPRVCCPTHVLASIESWVVHERSGARVGDRGKACGGCAKDNDNGDMLLCDGCPAAWHIFCLPLPVDKVPLLTLLVLPLLTLLVLPLLTLLASNGARPGKPAGKASAPAASRGAKGTAAHKTIAVVVISDSDEEDDEGSSRGKKGRKAAGSNDDYDVPVAFDDLESGSAEGEEELSSAHSDDSDFEAGGEAAAAGAAALIDEGQDSPAKPAKRVTCSAVAKKPQGRPAKPDDWSDDDGDGGAHGHGAVDDDAHMGVAGAPDSGGGGVPPEDEKLQRLLEEMRQRLSHLPTMLLTSKPVLVPPVGTSLGKEPPPHKAVNTVLEDSAQAVSNLKKGTNGKDKDKGKAKKGAKQLKRSATRAVKVLSGGEELDEVVVPAKDLDEAHHQEVLVEIAELKKQNGGSKPPVQAEISLAQLLVRLDGGTVSFAKHVQTTPELTPGCLSARDQLLLSIVRAGKPKGCHAAISTLELGALYDPKAQADVQGFPVNSDGKPMLNKQGTGFAPSMVEYMTAGHPDRRVRLDIVDEHAHWDAGQSHFDAHKDAMRAKAELVIACGLVVVHTRGAPGRVAMRAATERARLAARVTIAKCGEELLGIAPDAVLCLRDGRNLDPPPRVAPVLLAPSYARTGTGSSKSWWSVERAGELVRRVGGTLEGASPQQKDKLANHGIRTQRHVDEYIMCSRRGKQSWKDTGPSVAAISCSIDGITSGTARAEFKSDATNGLLQYIDEIIEITRKQRKILESPSVGLDVELLTRCSWAADEELGADATMELVCEVVRDVAKAVGKGGTEAAKLASEATNALLVHAGATPSVVITPKQRKILESPGGNLDIEIRGRCSRAADEKLSADATMELVREVAEAVGKGCNSTSWHVFDAEGKPLPTINAFLIRNRFTSMRPEERDTVLKAAQEQDLREDIKVAKVEANGGRRARRGVGVGSTTRSGKFLAQAYLDGHRHSFGVHNTLQEKLNVESWVVAYWFDPGGDTPEGLVAEDELSTTFIPSSKNSKGPKDNLSVRDTLDRMRAAPAPVAGGPKATTPCRQLGPTGPATLCINCGIRYCKSKSRK